jgi:hypothetical protein
MNLDEAKLILLRYRPGTAGVADADDPQVAEALALAKSNAGLSQWFAEHCERQKILREKFRQITPPAGLLEQIVSEHAANQRTLLARRRFIQIAVATAVVLVLALVGLFWINQGSPTDNTLDFFKKQMAGYALRGYAMDLQTNDAGEIRAYLKAQHSPADYALHGRLQQAALTGCAVENWQSGKVSMICFRTGKPLALGAQNDLWLFVVDQTSVPDASADSTPTISKVNRLVTATWVENGKLYLLGTTEDETVLRQFL